MTWRKDLEGDASLADLTVSGTLSTDNVKFPATQVASADANTLDDYEEGTFTPGISFGGSSTGITYAGQQGFYTKIGRLVHVVIQINLSDKGAQTGNALVTALPFTSSTITNSSFVVSRWINMANIVNMAGFGDNNATSITLRNAAAVSSGTLQETDFTDTSRFWMAGSYFV